MYTTNPYKGYVGYCDYSEEDKVCHGRILYIQDLITFQSDDWDTLQAAFEQAVDHYLDFCTSVGDTPNTPGVPGCRPIEEAPRDGTRILVMRPHDLTPYEAWYSGPEYNSWHTEVGGWFEHDEVHYWKPCDQPTELYHTQFEQGDGTKVQMLSDEDASIIHYDEPGYKLTGLTSVFPNN